MNNEQNRELMIASALDDDAYYAREHHNVFRNAHNNERPSWCDTCTEITNSENYNILMNRIGCVVMCSVILMLIVAVFVGFVQVVEGLL
jgi:hypothetical protein